LSCRRTARAAEPELYTRALMSVLLHYPEFVVIAVTEPATSAREASGRSRHQPAKTGVYALMSSRAMASTPLRIASKLKKLRDGRKISIPPDRCT
jgi:hypothetical protein